MTEKLDYDDFNDQLKRAGSEHGASEAHGLMCGMLCMGHSQNGVQLWLSTVLNEQYSEENSTLHQLKESADALLMDVLAEINHESLQFSLLLPDDSETLAERTSALAAWCQGFNYGLAVGGYKQTSTTNGDVVELIRDFSEIARAGYDADAMDIDEEEEVAFSDVEEYVRVGVMLIMEELQPIKLKSPIVH